MSDSEKKDLPSLLGKKREKSSEKDSSSEDNNKKKAKKEESDSNSESSESSKPHKSLFGANEKGFTGGLFGDLDNPSKSSKLFGDSKPTSGSLFGNTSGSLFGDAKKNEGENKNSLFGQGLFDFSNVNNKKENEEENNEEGDDNIGKSNSPKHEYNPEEEEEKEESDGYIRRYAKKVDNTLLYDKEQKKFVSKGEGFIIIESQENKEDKKRYVRIVYRNSIGGIIFQGILNDKINKCNPYEKKLKHICHIIFLMKENSEKENLVLGQAKILFINQEEIKKFENNIQYMSSGYNHCEYLDQNPDFCDYMEDYILTMNNFNKESFRHLFCVFDGHGGEDSAKLCVKKYPEIFKQCLFENPFDYELAIKNSFHLMDKEIEKMNLNEVGNTGTIVFINNRLLYCSNVGDSSCCLIGKNNEFITIDHKCTNKKEQKRIEKEGGSVIDDRLDGILAISRGFGDFDLKNKGFSCEPHITKKLIDNSFKYCVLASDGVWDSLNLDDVSKIVYENENNFKNIAKIIGETAKRRASEDNISCIVIELNQK